MKDSVPETMKTKAALNDCKNKNHKKIRIMFFKRSCKLKLSFLRFTSKKEIKSQLPQVWISFFKKRHALLLISEHLLKNIQGNV